jgi:hypothetical protein
MEYLHYIPFPGFWKLASILLFGIGLKNEEIVSWEAGVIDPIDLVIEIGFVINCIY